jgi:hypothetical protein
MDKVDSSDLAGFARKYNFAGSRLGRVKLRLGPECAVELVLVCKRAVQQLGAKSERVKLRLRMVGVEEFRFQKRPGGRSGIVPDARFGFFEGLVYVNLDAYGLRPGEKPGQMDFRASEMFVAGQDLFVEEMEKKPKAL